MSKQHNVFITWSGDQSRHVAEALTRWLPRILQKVKPWMSQSSIDKGSRWFSDISSALSDTKVGIVCLTPENLGHPWVLWEAGALAKTVDDRTRLCTYLLCDLQPQDVPPPLGMFQATKAEKEDTLELLRTINKSVGGDEPVPEEDLQSLFESLWPQFDDALEKIPAVRSPSSKRSNDDLLVEILENVRSYHSDELFEKHFTTLGARLEMMFDILTRGQRVMKPSAVLSPPVNAAITVRTRDGSTQHFIGKVIGHDVVSHTLTLQQASDGSIYVLENVVGWHIEIPKDMLAARPVKD